MKESTLTMFTDTVHEENSLIWIKPLCDLFNISLQNQQRKFKNDPILEKLWTKKSTVSAENEKLVGKKSTDFGEIDANGRILLSKKGFLRWIQTINPNTIDENLREKFIEYQEKVSDYLFGSMEEHDAIARVNAELTEWKQKYSEAGNMVRQKNAERDELLNKRYQYRLPFTSTAAIDKQ